ESADLLDIVVTMRTEFVNLGHEAHYFRHMRWLPEIYEKAMTSGDGTRIGFVMELPRKIHAEIPLIAKWEKSKDPIAIYTMDVDAAIDYVDKMIGWGDFQNIDPRAPTHDDIKHIGGLTFIMARTTHGEIGYSLPGVVKNPPKEDLEILQRFAGAFDLAHRRFLDLKQAEAQAREAQIETALERVRAKSMGMQKSEDLWEVAELLFEQVKYLGIDTWSCGVSLWYDDDSYFMGYNPGPDGKIGAPMPIPLTEDIFFTTIRDAKRRGEDFLVFESAGKSLEETYRYMDTLPIVGEVMRGIVKAGFDLPEFQVTHCGFFSHGHLMFITLERKPEAIDIFKRFTKVFEQTYTRFLDLQKAEKQAREAQIEAALERTRTQSMLMQHSDQLDATSKVFHEQLQLLGIDTEFSYVWLPDEAKNEHQFWVAWNSEKKESSLIQSKAIVYPLDKTEPYTAACFEDWESGASVHIHHIEPKEVKTFFTAWEELLKDAKNLSPEYFLNGLYYAEAFMKYGCFGINIKRPITNEEKQILQRFSIEFERTYTRFLDLQKAEAQAREAQIEAALEKIRSRSLAMTKPDELQEVVSVVAEKLKELGVIYDAGGVILCTYFPDNKDVMHWIAAPDFTYSGNYLVPYFKNPIFDDAWESKLRGDAYFSKEFSVEDKNAFFKYAFEHSDYRHFPDEFKQHALQAVKHTLTAAWQKNSAIIIPSFSGDRPSESEADILKRFSKVFEQAYIRFLDLQKAEELTKKSKIEVALERVRARALAMQQPEELKEVAQVLRAEMGLLGIEELETSSIYINDKETNKTECWFAIKDLRSKKKKLVTDHFKLNLNDTWVGTQMLQFYDSKNEDTSIVMTGKNRVEWIRYCEEHSAPFRGHYGKIIPDRTYHLFKFSDGAIGVATPGDISEENWELLKRVAGVFSLAYSRFKDLTQARVDLLKLKDEKKKAEDALSELQLTQKQLIQSEKMASLGELTAGIAHEIQNPLNFVNNFSEVSQELIDELKEELENGNMDEVKEILNDVIQNLEKINHHGKRADGIVKGMLQHSRKSSAEKEPTNINKLADEYLRLAYHGLRAKDKSFNATLVTDFDESIGMVPVIPQDMGRVILNLITNAFYAVSERKKASEENHFEPTVSVSTKKEKDKVIISVKDNGNGVPTPVLDKIFQPFFTTKPTGEGTGLGLSMSYDIVTKGHSGELKVKTKENKGTEFKIIIPITKN
ncbi:ATP-binding protein, partial [Altibacter sp.]|uniref:sensor histidine kinase n=1 Tax=Altibacter sp. TaxID=2024823 RepID=UPI00258D1A82